MDPKLIGEYDLEKLYKLIVILTGFQNNPVFSFISLVINFLSCKAEANTNKC